MMNFFVYARSVDNEFFSCAIQVDCPHTINPDTLVTNLHAAARKRFAELGRPLPPDEQLIRLRCVPDGRATATIEGVVYPSDRPYKPARRRVRLWDEQ